MTSIRFTGDLQSRNFSIAYSDSDPKISYMVVKSLLDAFVAQSVQVNRSDSESAQKFLTQQLADYEKRLTSPRSDSLISSVATSARCPTIAGLLPAPPGGHGRHRPPRCGAVSGYASSR